MTSQTFAVCGVYSSFLMYFVSKIYGTRCTISSQGYHSLHFLSIQSALFYLLIIIILNTTILISVVTNGCIQWEYWQVCAKKTPWKWKQKNKKELDRDPPMLGVAVGFPNTLQLTRTVQVLLYNKAYIIYIQILNITHNKNTILLSMLRKASYLIGSEEANINCSGFWWISPMWLVVLGVCIGGLEVVVSIIKDR